MPVSSGGALRRGRRAPRLVLGLLAVALAGCSAPTAAPGPRPLAADTASQPVPPTPRDKSPTVLGVPFPGDDTVGIPPSVQLTPYTGSCDIITDGTVIDSAIVDCRLDIRAADVVISNSKVNQPISVDTDLPGSQQWSLTVQDTEVDGGTAQLAAIGWGNVTVLRSNVYGGQTAVQCYSSAEYCIVRDSWLHGQYVPPDGDWHLGGFLSNGGRNIELTGNTIACDARPTAADGGCTGNLNLLPDFAPISHVTVDGNLFRANTGSPFCTFGGDSSTKPYPNADHVVYRNNIFERGTNGRCGTYGPVTEFDPSGTGNEWINNRWDDGTPVRPG
jgi:hypothetical protein